VRLLGRRSLVAVGPGGTFVGTSTHIGSELARTRRSGGTRRVARIRHQKDNGFDRR
jgi:hypothetical protein